MHCPASVVTSWVFFPKIADSRVRFFALDQRWTEMGSIKVNTCRGGLAWASIPEEG
jgi:hypothetical protein